MKRKLALFAIVLAVLMLVPAFALAAESDETAPLESITITTQPSKTTYSVGESFNPSGIVITAQYCKDLAGTTGGSVYTGIGYSESNGFKNSMEGKVFTTDDVGKTIKVTIYYTKNLSTESATVDVTVKGKNLKSLVADNSAANLYYFVGESFDKTGLKATATFEDNASSPNVSTETLVASQLTVESHTFTADEAGKTVPIKVSYTYGGVTKTDSIDAYVYDLTKLTVKTSPKKEVYYVGESFDSTGTEFEATYSVNSKTETKDIALKYVIVDAKTYENKDAGNTVDITLSFTYADTTATVGIPTYVYKLNSITVTTPPYKTEYNAGESFIPAGMVLKGTFANPKDSTTKDVVLSGYTYSRSPLTAGTTSANVYYTYAGTKSTATTPITVTEIKGSYIYLDKASLFMKSGEQTRLNAVILPEETTDLDITWTTSDSTVATVDKYGMVSAVGGGSTYVSAEANTTSGKMSVKCYVNVEEGTPITSIKFNKTNLDILLGDSTKLSPTIVPTDATAVVTWSSSSSKIVSVNSDGTIKGLKEGTSVISAYCDGMTAKMNVTVCKTLTTSGTVVNCQRRVNVRAKASGSSSSIGYAYLGQTFKILDEVDNWYKIQFNASKVGYIWKKYLSSNGGKDYTPVSETSTVAQQTTDTVSVTATETDVTITAGTTSVTTATKVTVVNCNRYIYIRKGAGTAYSKIGHAVPGAVFTLKGVSGDWYAIDYNGQVGYIHKDFCQLG